MDRDSLLAFVRFQMGEAEQSLADYGQMRAILERLASDHPATLAYRLDLAKSHTNRGNVLLARFQDPQDRRRRRVHPRRRIRIPRRPQSRRPRRG